MPPGLGADLYLWANEVRGTGACNPFDSTYTVGRDRLTIFPPEVQPATCDPEAAGLDEILLKLLTDVSSWTISGSQMTLSDAAGEEMLTFTNARVPEDPTIAPWRLSRWSDPTARSVARSRAATRSSASCLAGGSPGAPAAAPCSAPTRRTARRSTSPTCSRASPIARATSARRRSSSSHPCRR